MRILASGIMVKEINATNGDLVDLEFRHRRCYEEGLEGPYAYWYQDYREAIPSDFSTDYDTYCKSCLGALTEIEEETPSYIVLVDDGTLDTVIECLACERQFRFNYDPSSENEEEPENWEDAYSAFVEECIAEIESEHDCEEEEE